MLAITHFRNLIFYFYIFSQFDAKRLNHEIKYSRKTRNLQYLEVHAISCEIWLKNWFILGIWNRGSGVLLGIERILAELAARVHSGDEREEGGSHTRHPSRVIKSHRRQTQREMDKSEVSAEQNSTRKLIILFTHKFVFILWTNFYVSARNFFQGSCEPRRKCFSPWTSPYVSPCNLFLK